MHRGVRARLRVPYFRIFYSTTFTVLTLILIALLLVEPGDGIYQAYRNNQLWMVVIIAGTYLLTFVISVFIYATRLYTNRSHLASIPTPWIPIKRGDVTKSVRRMIAESLQRSASIAYNAHPRVLKEDGLDNIGRTGSGGSGPQTQHARQPTWGIIAHPGWSSPSSPDLPNLHYEPVLLELPHLIEAKAVSLAPPDPLYQPDPDIPDAAPLPDAIAVALLQRPSNMGLRDYLAHLTSLSMLPAAPSNPSFLPLYERARFASSALTEPEFRDLMSAFASLLRSITPPSPTLIAALHAEASESNASSASSLNDNNSLSTTDTVEHIPFYTPAPHHGFDGTFDGVSLHTTDAVEYTPFHTPMPHHGFDPSPRDASEGSLAGSEGTAHTALSRPRLKQRTSSRNNRLPSSKSVAQRTRSSNSLRPAAYRTASSTSLQRTRTGASVGSQQSGGSVIHLREARTELDLPFVFAGMEDTMEEGF